MKKLLAILLCCIIVVLPMNYAMASSEEAKVGGLYSDETYDGFELSWTNNGKRDVLLSAADESGTISFQYDENGYRTSKTNAAGETTLFAYDAAHNLIAVQNGTHLLE